MHLDSKQDSNFSALITTWHLHSLVTALAQEALHIAEGQAGQPASLLLWTPPCICTAFRSAALLLSLSE